MVLVCCLSLYPVLSVCLSVCGVRALWPNGWTDQDETSHARRSQPWPHCVKSRPSFPSPKGAQPPPNFRPISVAAKWLHGQDVTWYGARPQPRRLCVSWGPRSTLHKKSRAPQFSAHFYCGQMDACIKMPLGMKVGFNPGDFVLDGNLAHVQNFRPMFTIVIVTSLEHCTMHSRYWVIQVQVLVFCAFYF